MIAVHRLRAWAATNRVVLGGKAPGRAVCCCYAVTGRRPTTTLACNTTTGPHERHYGRHLLCYYQPHGTRAPDWYPVGVVCPRCAVEIRALWQANPPTPDAYVRARLYSRRSLLTFVRALDTSSAQHRFAQFFFKGSSD